MATPLIPQEIFLLERYSSLDYFGEMRDAWAKMLDAAEQALRQLLTQRPADYRKRPLSMQPDVVWGGRVLPNFRSTMAYLNKGFIELSHGDHAALKMAGGVLSDIKGQTFDYSAEWMAQDLQDQFWHWQGVASQRASNISFTASAGWDIGDLSIRYASNNRGALNPPASWPLYRLNPSVTVKTGEPVQVAGIYLPACDDSCAQFLYRNNAFPEVDEANIGYDPKRMQRVGTAPTTWTLVERVADSGGGIPGAKDPTAQGIRLRCEAGHPCPQGGYWFTPAAANSRCHFAQGVVMPEIKSDYGLTIWQWDEGQG
jgi:hypothetical protein